jgi:fused-like protein
LIKSCSDDDANVRKFACFAIGNAAFHSDELYEALRPSVVALREALRDPDDKTRANAAGALGNLCRNSGVLSSSISEHKVVVELMLMVMKDSTEACQVIHIHIVLYN